MQEVVDKVPDHTALAVKRNSEWVKWTYREYQEDVKTVAKEFIKLGLKPHCSVNKVFRRTPGLRKDSGFV